MQKKWLIKINFLILSGVLFLFLLAFFYYWIRPSEISQRSFDAKKVPLPSSAFAQTKEAYNSIGPPLLDLYFTSPSMRLPDLRNLLIYYGKNGRPDALAERPLLHFGFAGAKTAVSIPIGEKLYLLYDKSQVPARYIFSADNHETGLWIEPQLQGNEALIKVAMKNENGETIREPQALSQFNLPEKEYARFTGGVWELGKWRVDGTLLARQRARWFGTDLFLEQHGGDEYKDAEGAQAIEFGEATEKYTVNVKPGDSLIWKEDAWNVVTPGKGSLGYPMLVVKKIDDRLMNLELWDVEGKGKILLNLLKSTDPILSQNIVNDFKFVGARTRSQFVFEIRNQRIYLRPEDWFLLTEEGWRKLTTSEDIDNYVYRKTPGILFVVNQITRKEDRQVLVGTIFNPSRSQMETVEIPMLSSSTIAQTGTKAERNRESSSDSSFDSDLESSEDTDDSET